MMRSGFYISARLTRQILFCLILFCYNGIKAQEIQEWTLKIKSNVSVRTWNLTDQAVKDEKVLENVSVALYLGTTKVNQTKTDEYGDFEVFVPSYGVYELVISHNGCTSKKIEINTEGIPTQHRHNHFRPRISIDGFVLSIPFPGVDYSPLQKALVKVEYDPVNVRFRADEASVTNGLATVAKIYEAEETLANTFCNTNKEGNGALANGDCELAKKTYEKAIAMIPGAQYPVDQLKKADRCIKDKEAEAEAQARIAAYKKAVAETESKNGQEPIYASADKKGDLVPNNNVSNVKSQEVDSAAILEANKVAAERIAAELKSNYAASVKVADALFAKKKFEEAETVYYEALQFLPNETYPKTQIVAVSKNLSRENPGANDKKYQEAILKAEKYLGAEYKEAIKKNYQDALTYVGDATYEKSQSEEIEKLVTSDGSVKSPEFIAAMIAKYPRGLTEETTVGKDVVIVRRVLIKDGNVWVYQKKTFSWGGVAYFRDGLRVTGSTFDYESAAL